MQRAHVFSLNRRPGSRAPYQVRWRVHGRDHSRQFQTKAKAEQFRSQLLLAADDTDRFDPRTGLLDQKATTPVSSQAATCYAVAIEFVARKWDGWAGKTRASAVETLTIAVTSLIDPDAPPPPVAEEHVRSWLRHIALRPPFDDNGSDLAQRCRHHFDSAAHDWLIRYSLPVSRVDMATAEATLTRFATRLDGAGSTAATVTRRRRSVFGAYLKYAVRSGQLAADPLSASDWKPPLVDREVSPDLVATLNEARALLDATEHGGKRGQRLTAFFATLYFAGLRPSEALALTAADLDLPADGWGTIHVRRSRTAPGTAFTATGSSHEQRPLKWRASRATRQVPIPPELVTHLRRHLARYPATPDSLIFTNQAGGPVHPSAYSRAFGQAKQVAFPASSPLRRSSPYWLRHGNATLLLNSGVPIAEAARRLGHSPDVLLSVYAGVTTSDRDTANALIDAVLDTLP